MMEARSVVTRTRDWAEKPSARQTAVGLHVHDRLLVGVDAQAFEHERPV
jgi:hypothetical protein